jgi:hypothetical protein
MKYLVVLLVYTCCALAACSQSGYLKVIIIRHAEKDEASGNLSCQGLHRALLLPPVLNSKFGRPAYIYVPSITTGKSTGHARMFQTVTPLAVQAGIPINSKYAETDGNGVAAEIMKKTGLVLLVWEHDNIPAVARALGVKGKDLKWNGSDFDSIWIITYVIDNKGKLKATLSTDSEGLKPSPSCNF